MWRTLQKNSLVKYSMISTPLLILGGVGYTYYDRSRKLDNPVAHRALKVLLADKRVVDFCGENIKPGWIVNRKENSKEGTMTYTFNVTGASGKLKTVVTADSAIHGSLKIFNEELEEHAEKKATQAKDYDVKDFEDNWPIDLEEYDIPDEPLFHAWKNDMKIDQVNRQKIDEEDKIWRIKSLRVSVDEDTRIMILPLPESKREKQLIDTRYTLETNGDLYNKYFGRQESFKEIETEEYKRFEDKTPEEIAEDIKHKRRKQFQQMTKVRKYQFGGIFAALIFYMLIWPRVAPKPILGSTLYNYALDLIKKSKVVKDKVGSDFMVTCCNGKVYPMLKNTDFEIVVKGPKDQAKFLVTPKVAEDTEDIESIVMLTKKDLKSYVI